MCESPIANDAQVNEAYEAIKEINPECRVVKTIFRPRPIGDISGKRVVTTLTTPAVMTDAISTHLENTYGCEVLGVSNYLSNRPRLREDLERFEALKPDAVVSELKAAAVDVVTAWALERGIEIVYLDNEPITKDDGINLEDEVMQVADKIKRLPKYTKE